MIVPVIVFLLDVAKLPTVNLMGPLALQHVPALHICRHQRADGDSSDCA